MWGEELLRSEIPQLAYYNALQDVESGLLGLKYFVINIPRQSYHEVKLEMVSFSLVGT